MLNTILSDRLDVQYIIAIIIYAITYIYAIELAPVWSKRKGAGYDQINAMHERCYLSVPGVDFTKIRGNDYYIGVMDAEKQEQLKSCFITFWGLSHFIMYSLLGFFAPRLFLPTFALGVVFEGIEADMFDCQDGLDVLLNTTGFVFGAFLREKIKPPYPKKM